MLQASIRQRPMYKVGFQREHRGGCILHRSGGTQAIWKRWCWYVVMAVCCKFWLITCDVAWFTIAIAILTYIQVCSELDDKYPRSQISATELQLRSVICYQTPVTCYRRPVTCYRRPVICCRRSVICYRTLDVCHRTSDMCYRTPDICFLRYLLNLHVPFPHDNHTCSHPTSLLWKYRV